MTFKLQVSDLFCPLSEHSLPAAETTRTSSDNGSSLIFSYFRILLE